MLNEKELREAVDRRLSGLTASGERRIYNRFCNFFYSRSESFLSAPVAIENRFPQILRIRVRARQRHAAAAEYHAANKRHFLPDVFYKV